MHLRLLSTSRTLFTVIALLAALSCGGGSTPVTPTGPSATCAFAISPAVVNVGAISGPTVLTVTTGPTCGWNVVSSQPFLTVTSGTGQTGPGTVTFTVAENTGGARGAMLTIGGQVVTVNQAAAPPPLAFAPPAAPDATIGAAYNVNFAVATGGIEPIRYQLDTLGGFPPIGLVLGANGTLSGTPTVGGPVLFSICAVDAAGRSVCRQVSVTVRATVEEPAFGRWSGSITLREGCITPLPFTYSFTGTIRRGNTGAPEIAVTIPLLAINNDVVPLTITGNTVSFQETYGPYRYDYVGLLSTNRDSLTGTFVGTNCAPLPPPVHLQSGTWNGVRIGS